MALPQSAHLRSPAKICGVPLRCFLRRLSICSCTRSKTSLETMGSCVFSILTHFSEGFRTCFHTMISELDDLAAELEKKQNAYSKAQKTADASHDEYERMHRVFLAEQAGILVQELLDGEPCPVCGSREHPAPARLSAQAPREAELKALKRKADADRSVSEKASRAASETLGKKNAAETELENRGRALFDGIEQSGWTEEAAR